MCRTSKIQAGAQRRSVIGSEVASLRQNLETLTLESVLAEVTWWCRTARSPIRAQLDKLQTATNPLPASEPGI